MPGARDAPISIWLWAFGYFAAYAPYSALTKALSSGALGNKVPGNAILPMATLASALGMAVFLASTGWWRSAARLKVGRLSLPVPTRWTLLSGLCSAAIITTTTLAYTFDGVSIVLMMLMMRGGVLVIAPIIDKLTGRVVQRSHWVALALTMAALVVAAATPDGLGISLLAALNVLAYVAFYFVRLRLMSRLAKSDASDLTRKYFVEEQLVASPAAFVALGLLAMLGEGRALLEIRSGFTAVPFSSSLPVVVAIGLFSMGTGIFGALVLLDRRSNSFTVPVNRGSSVLAGVLSTVGLSALLGLPAIETGEVLGAVLVLAAIATLSLPEQPARSR